MKKELHPKAEPLAERLTTFFNIAFQRNIRGSRQFSEAVSSALKDGYTEDEIRLAFWVARCATGEAAWLGERLRSSMLPHIVLRHHGRLNNQTGKEALRWLDDLLARAGEANGVMVRALLNILPESRREDEKALLDRMGVVWR